MLILETKSFHFRTNLVASVAVQFQDLLETLFINNKRVDRSNQIIQSFVSIRSRWPLQGKET